MSAGDKKRAVIDVGSNSIRLMIDEDRALNEKKLAATRLGGGLALTGLIDDEAMERSVEAVFAFVREAERAGAEPYIFATEAVRSAGNGGAFCRRVKSRTGRAVDVIDGETEAKIAFLGAGNRVGECAVIDAGGASTEVTLGRDGVIASAVSVKVGAVRLKSMGLDRAAAAKYVDERISVLPPLPPIAIAVGGTATALAAADLGLTEYLPESVHRHRLTLDALGRLLTDFEAGDICKKYPAITPKRAEIILFGGVIFDRILRRAGLDSMIVSETDNCEGYLLYKKGSEASESAV